MSKLRLFAALCAVVLATCGANPLQNGREIDPTVQYVSFFAETQCGGEPKNLTDTNLDIPGLGDEFLNRTESWIPNGLWKISRTQVSITSINRYGYQTCRNYGSEFGPLESLERLIPFNFDESAFLASEGDYYREPRHLLPPGEERMVFDPPIYVLSWAFTGNSSFVVYERADHDTPVLCLEPDFETVERGYGIQWDTMGLSVDVGAIQRVITCPQNVKRLVVENKADMTFVHDKNGNEVRL